MRGEELREFNAAVKEGGRWYTMWVCVKTPGYEVREGIGEYVQVKSRKVLGKGLKLDVCLGFCESVKK